jgi:hypothetical protein
MADFRVAHLSFRQTDVASACAQLGAWIIPVELVVKWSRSEKSCVAIFLALVPAARINAPAVTNDKHYRTSHTSRTLPMNEKNDKRFFLQSRTAGTANKLTLPCVIKDRLSPLRLLFVASFAAVVDRRYREGDEVA